MLNSHVTMSDKTKEPLLDLDEAPPKAPSEHSVYQITKFT